VTWDDDGSDDEVFGLIERELDRQQTTLQLIASENFTSPAVLAALGSTLSNKYAEGYPGRRYYGGCEQVDQAESIGIARAKELFGAEHTNLQPHSGASANLAVYAAFCRPGDKVLAMSLPHGGHLTHGSKVSFSGRWFTPVPYTVRKDTELIDYDEVRDLALEHRPTMIVAGATAYPRLIDFAAFREIADETGAILWVDAAHFIGLVAGKVIPSPVPYADVVSFTTHKVLRGPRGGMIVSRALMKRVYQDIEPWLLNEWMPEKPGQPGDSRQFGDVAAVDAAQGRVRYRRTIGACFFPQYASPAAAAGREAARTRGDPGDRPVHEVTAGCVRVAHHENELSRARGHP